MSMDSHFCTTCGEFHCALHLPVALSAPKGSAELKTKSYFVIWHGYQDGVSHGKVIQVPEGQDPEAAAFSFLTDNVGMNEFRLKNVREVREGEVIQEF